MSSETSKEMQSYLNNISNSVIQTYSIASKARKKGFDPEDEINIPLAKNMAERVEGLISAVFPQISNSGLPKRIKTLETKYGKLDWRVAFDIALETAKQKFCKFKNEIESIEAGIRVGLAYLTLGVVASPIEGFVGLKLRKRQDGKKYFSLFYSGPIRSAGGTGAAASVLVADYIRKSLGYEKYDPTEKEIKRTITELYDYHERVTNLQYLPTKEEIEYLVKKLPVQIDGDPSEEIEVSNYKDLDRVSTNKIRSGACLVVGECLAQKAKKLWVNISKWGSEFKCEDWYFLEKFIKIQTKSKSKETPTSIIQKVNPNHLYIKDLVAGRPVLTHPLKDGGFRLRYGRSRTSGYSAASIHPATMYISNKYLAIGTQLKVERPGKGCAITACDTIEGPIVKLNNGNVQQINSLNQAKDLAKDIQQILFLGDILFNYGDFYNRAHNLVPPGYCEEWWIQEVEKAIVDLFGTFDLNKLAELIGIQKERLDQVLKNHLTEKPSAKEAIDIAKKTKSPLHPKFTYYWNSITKEELLQTLEWFQTAKITINDDVTQKIILSYDKDKKKLLEKIGLPHINANQEYIVIDKDIAISLSVQCNLTSKQLPNLLTSINIQSKLNNIEILNSISKIKIRDKGGIFIGARMGRPEKAKMRKLVGSPHTLFPVSNEGGRLRSFQSALEEGKITAEFPVFQCNSCKKETIFPICEECKNKTKRKHYCKICGLLDSNCNKTDARGNKHYSPTFRLKEIDINSIMEYSLKTLGMKTYPDLIKGVRGTSNDDHTPENPIKGILRAKHNIYVNKDGTTRYDMTQLPITHFKPKEVMLPLEKLKKLGYFYDINGNKLTNSNQILELKPQDLILPACEESPERGADSVLLGITKFIDDLLVKFYNLKPFYNAKSKEDLEGHLVVVLSPHTSAGIVGRILGFSRTLGLFAHPMLHAATRRDCDGDEASVILLMDTLLNFSRKYLPLSRGATQDAPLVLTSTILPSEVDDMFFDLDICWKYPLEFYNACIKHEHPRNVDIDQAGSKLNTPEQYEKMGFTHNTSDINLGVRCSAYKTLPSMKEKLFGQMDLADKIRAVDAPDVARLVIEKHFLRDIRGNLRKFSMQQFRCVKCNQKYRRPPLIGRCTECGGKIIFTISEGSIIKYLEPAISLAEKYSLPPYVRQTLELTKLRVEGVFGKEKEKQEGLNKWF